MSRLMSEGALITVSPCSYYNGQSESLSTEAMTTVMCMRRSYGYAYVPWTILSYETG